MLTATLCLLSAMIGATVGAIAMAACNVAAGADRLPEPAPDLIVVRFTDEPASVGAKT